MARPIVLLEKNDNFHASISELVAPNNHHFNWCYMSYAPIHHVLVPHDAKWVMTSGNASGDSVIYDDEKSFFRIADYSRLFFDT